MTSFMKFAFMLMTSLVLVACGGGGGGSSSPGGPLTPPSLVTVAVTATQTQLPSNRGDAPPRIDSQFSSEVLVRVRNPNGTAVADGTTVTVTVADSNLGRLYVPIAGAGDPGGGAPELVSSLQVNTQGGDARVFFHSGRNTGSALIRATVNDPNTPARTVTGEVRINVVQGPEPIAPLDVQAASTQLPSNRGNAPPRLDSPFSTEITVRVRNGDGTAVADGTNVSLAVSNSSIGRLWTLENGAVSSLQSSVQVQTVAGVAKAFFHTGQQTGTAVVTVTTADPLDASRTVSATVAINVVQGPEPVPVLTVTAAANQLPSNRGDAPQRLDSPFSTEITVRVRNGDGTAVADGTNVSLAVSNSAIGRLWALTDGVASPLQSTLQVQTVAGSANAFFHSGQQAGTSVITVTTADPTDPSRTVTATVAITVIEGPDAVPVLTITSTADQLPSNLSDAAPRLDSPFSTEITVRARNRDGTPLVDGTVVSLSVSDSTIGRFWTIEDGEVSQLSSSVQLETVAGQAKAFFHSGRNAGLAEITATTADPANTALTVSASLAVLVVEGPVAIDPITLVVGSPEMPSNRGGLTPRLDSPFTTEVTVRVRNGDGTAVADDTEVSIAVDDTSLGRLYTVDEDGELTPLQGQVRVLTTAGLARAYFHTGARTGVALITATTADPADPTRIVSAQAVINVVEGPEAVPRLVLEAVRTTLPANTQGVPPFIGSPFLTEVTVTWRTQDGALVPGGLEVGVSVNPVLTSGAFSTLDDPETEDVNEFEVLMGQGPVNVVAGKATIFFHSLSIPGETTMTVTAQDPNTLEVLEVSQVFTIVAVSPPLPADVSISDSGQPVYITSSGGNTTRALQIFVSDGAGDPVPDPQANGTRYNNVLVELVPVDTTGGESLTGVDANGEPVQGQSIRLGTTNGIANALFRAGSEPGIVQVRVTADGADNNVDNGIIDPVSSLRAVVVSDGRLFSMRIASPRVNTIRVNRVDPDVEFDGDPIETPDPDGTYSLTVSAIATDRGGNPVLANTPIQFGLLDEPLSGFPNQGSGFFDISGTDGDPEEGGNLFRAPGGRFQTDGGGAGPGDTLVIFGKEVPGNRDLESARTIQEVLSQTQLRVTQRFNNNDDTGSIVDFGPVLPYVIGRAADGNINTNVLTNNIGVATTKMNYPVSRLGKSVIVWARGAGDIAGGSTELVTDTAFFVFPGVAPASLTAAPGEIPRGATSLVTLCLVDALRHGIQGVFIGFNSVNAGSAVTVDGQSNSGTVLNPTGAGGCTVAEVTVAGFIAPQEDEDSLVRFFAGAASADVLIADAGDAILQVTPSGILGNRGSPGQVFNLRLIDSGGAPISGVQLTAECSGSGGAVFNIVQFPGVTNASGQTTARIIAENLDQFNGSGSGTCTFSTSSGSPSAEVEFSGRDLCEFAGTGGFSPGPGVNDPCDTSEPVETANVSIAAVGPVGSGSLSLQPGATTVLAAPGGTVGQGQFDAGALVFASATPNTAAGFCFDGWSGNACAAQSPQNLVVSFNAQDTNPQQSCIATFRSAGVIPAPSICP